MGALLPHLQLVALGERDGLMTVKKAFAATHGKQLVENIAG